MTRHKALPTMRSSILKLLRCGGEYSMTQIAEHLHKVLLSKGRCDRSVILAVLRCDDTSKLAMTSLIEIYNVSRRNLADAQLDEANFVAGNSKAKKRIKTRVN
ncbi:hypothetical protein FEM48_Zijuj02G0151500 [Ziziphus jujuba var. spinosa]|uniref:Uncharacterized protein n=1 Tax=Ziziphus jujuba var. spinosa TaxID=714518 RepID=A0A978VWE3_ZIZJJ|nr:hypothetical protein FEM48_Zijuj02G0151500 [Ziziphus jujuba var. spinosa]